MTEHPTLQNRPPAQRVMLNALKKRGALAAEDLASTANITISGTRQHLTLLETDGLVTHTETRVGRGRPKHQYQLTPAADALYPRTYSELTNEILEYLEPEALETVFARRRERRLAQAKIRLEPLPTLEARVTELTRILDEDGYLADVTLEENGYKIIEHNCAIFAVALKYGQACSSELEFIRAALPEADVQRVAHMASAGHVCAYAIKKR
jgi:DeoR family transcriptional regulator, suf operon transcriptional repressor